ncbi:hypothetical protein LCGC14_2777400 [marine sediment metagenome]|uniref:Uncharacterized protein n=1 Tax=marine sediment metagenome TaxID=412755 RepID=A0A0F8ZGB4_9ZZZZ
MALHDPVEDALNARKARARRVEAGDAFGSEVTQRDLDTTRKFLGGGIGTSSQAGSRLIPSPQPPGRGPARALPSQVADIARRRAFGQQGSLQRNDPRAITPIIREDERLRGQVSGLRDRFFNLPGPVDFSRTPEGKSMLQRILQLRGLR